MPKFIWKIIGIVLVLSFLTPLPGGTFLSALGLSILICSSLNFALWVQARRQNNAWLNRGFMWMERKLGNRWSGDLKSTRPDADLRDKFKDT